MGTDHTMAIFAAELILLLFFGRMLGEVMGRIGQPAIFGQLLAGVLLGPSVFGALLPELQHLIFPGTLALKSMIDAIAQIGILLLLLLTGMETNLALVNRKRRAKRPLAMLLALVSRLAIQLYSKRPGADLEHVARDAASTVTLGHLRKLNREQSEPLAGLTAHCGASVARGKVTCLYALRFASGKFRCAKTDHTTQISLNIHPSRHIGYRRQGLVSRK
jgi:hypothetical protein